MKESLNGKRILLLNMMPDTLGDTVLITPFLRMIKKNYPKSFLAITTPKKFYEIFKNNPYIDEVLIVSDLDKFAKASRIGKYFRYSKLILSLAHKLRKKNFDVCLIGQPLISLTLIIPFLAGIKERIGYDFKGAKLRNLLTKKVKFKGVDDEPYRHYVESYFDLLREEKDFKINNKEIFTEVFPDKESKKKVEKLIKSKIGSIKKLVGFEAVSKFDGKTWNYKRYGRLAKYLSDKGYKVLLFGSPGERSQNELVRNASDNTAINFSGELLFSDLSAALGSCKFFVGNCSGLAHLAAASGTEVVTIFGATSPAHARALGKKQVHAIVVNNLSSPPIISGDYSNGPGRKYLDDISVDQVIKILRKYRLI